LTHMIEPLLTILGVMLGAFARLTKQVPDIARDEAVCRRLMSAPDVGPMTALAFRATIDQPERCRKSRDAGAHLGLTPRRSQSGEPDIQARRGRCGDELARTAPDEAAHSLLVRGRSGRACPPFDGLSGEAKRPSIVSHRHVLSVPAGDRRGRSARTRQRPQTSESPAAPLARLRARADHRPIANLPVQGGGGSPSCGDFFIAAWTGLSLHGLGKDWAGLCGWVSSRIASWKP